MKHENQVHHQNLVSWAANRPEVVVLSGDLTGSTEIANFKKAYPDRFYSMGMAEQNMMSVAGGMAREGLVPFVHTFAVFMYRRSLDQISMSIAYPNLRVRMVGFLPGIMTPGGATHQAIDDIGVLRALPNMTLLEPCDATEIESVLDVADQIDGPVYIRMMRKDVPRLFPKSQPMQFNRVRCVSEGDDFTLISSGLMTCEAMKVVTFFKRYNVNLRHLQVSTHKPFSDPALVEAIKHSPKGVMTLENHNVVSGLATEVSELMVEHGLAAPFYKVGLQDTYSFGSSQDYLMQYHGLDAASIAKKVATILGLDIQASPEDFKQVHLESAIAEEQMEAL